MEIAVTPLEEDSEINAAIIKGGVFEEFQRSKAHKYIADWMRHECAAYLDEMRQQAKATHPEEAWSKLAMRWMIAEDFLQAYEAMVATAIQKKTDALTMLKEKIIEHDIEH